MTQDEFLHYVEGKTEGSPELESKFYKALQKTVTINELSKFEAEWKERYFWSIDKSGKLEGSSLN